MEPETVWSVPSRTIEPELWLKVALAPLVHDPDSVVEPEEAVKVPADSCMFPLISNVPPVAVYVAPVPLIMKLKKEPEATILWLPDVPSKRTVLVPATKSPVPVASQEPETVIVEALEL